VSLRPLTTSPFSFSTVSLVRLFLSLWRSSTLSATATARGPCRCGPGR
jgi:hypothetical protein